MKKLNKGINKDIENVNTINRHNLVGTYRTIHPATAKYIFKKMYRVYYTKI